MDGEFTRTDGLFSLCGLNCGLCPMQIRGGRSGCFNGSTCYQTCPIAPCSVRRGGVDYCYQCEEYPCKCYDGIDLHDLLTVSINAKSRITPEKVIRLFLRPKRKTIVPVGDKATSTVLFSPVTGNTITTRRRFKLCVNQPIYKRVDTFAPPARPRFHIYILRR